MQVFTLLQRVSFEYLGLNYTFCVTNVHRHGDLKKDNQLRGILDSNTLIIFETQSNSGIKVVFIVRLQFVLSFFQLSKRPAHNAHYTYPFSGYF